LPCLLAARRSPLPLLLPHRLLPLRPQPPLLTPHPLLLPPLTLHPLLRPPLRLQLPTRSNYSFFRKKAAQWAAFLRLAEHQTACLRFRR
jgi:hypothetical protein